MTTEIATALEKHVVASINAERADAGLPALRIETHLNASAQAHSDWMADTGTFSHSGVGGSHATDRIGEADFPLVAPWRTSENIAFTSISGGLGTGEMDFLHEGLMESDGHRGNILDPDVSYVGVGVSVGTITTAGIEQDVVYLTQNFADTSGEVLVQEEVDGQTVLQPYQDGEPVGDPQPAPGDEEEPRPDEPDEDERDETSSSGGGCFVATAAYGDWSHPDIAALRRFRDEVLVRHAAGRAFIRTYRIVGPRLARWVTPEGRSGRIARAIIAPMARRAARRTPRR